MKTLCSESQVFSDLEKKASKKGSTPKRLHCCQWFIVLNHFFKKIWRNNFVIHGQLEQKILFCYSVKSCTITKFPLQNSHGCYQIPSTPWECYANGGSYPRVREAWSGENTLSMWHGILGMPLLVRSLLTSMTFQSFFFKRNSVVSHCHYVWMQFGGIWRYKFGQRRTI